MGAKNQKSDGEDIPLHVVWYSFGIFGLIGLLILFLIYSGDTFSVLIQLFTTSNFVHDVLIGIGIGTAACLLTLFLYKVTSVQFPINEQTKIIFKLAKKRFGVATIALAPGVIEEFLFRGVIMGSFMLMMPASFALIISTVIFFSLHIPQYKGSPLMHLSVFLMGLLLGSLYWYTGSLIAPIIAHSLYNGVLAWFMKNGNMRLAIEKEATT
ncbi:CPBP family intramembrane glutamic endopeptidase [Salsuginibacillus kocurii]|uniref:CPBP family intramembrane glutamic endopeptidase n=1 Tax=Salsuginibacillus kocurii TaxID=427078 RepID=UPI00035CEB07|nr:CPBP family intramembrane glutamic endopeptidase [Salsuginibacillus kocurii]